MTRDPAADSRLIVTFERDANDAIWRVFVKDNFRDESQEFRVQRGRDGTLQQFYLAPQESEAASLWNDWNSPQDEALWSQYVGKHGWDAFVLKHGGEDAAIDAIVDEAHRRVTLKGVDADA